MAKDRNLARLYNRLTDNPLFTILFLQEAVKLYVQSGFVLTDSVLHFGGLTAVSALLWVLSDADVDWTETVLGVEDEDG